VSTGDGPIAKTMLNPSAASHVELTIGFGRRGSGPNSPMGAVATARQAFLDAQWYAEVHKRYELLTNLPQPEYNASLAALAKVIASKQSVMFESTNEQMAMRAGDFAREFDLPMMLHGSGREYRAIDRIADLNCPVILPVDFPKAPEVSTPAAARAASLQGLMHWELAPSNPARLAEANILFAITSDGLDDPKEMLGKIREAIGRGLTPETALAALTSTPAKLLGISDVAGDLSVGKLASFVVTDGDLFGEKTKILSTWVSGAEFEIDTPVTSDWPAEWELMLVSMDDASKTMEIDLEINVGKKTSAKFKMDVEEEDEDEDEEESDDEEAEETDSDEGENEEDSETIENDESQQDDSDSAEVGSDEDGDEDAAADDDDSDSDSDSDEDDDDDSDEDDEKEIALKNVSFVAGKLTGQFKSNELWESINGTAQFTATLLRQSDSADQLLGSIVLPDGTRYRVTGVAEEDGDEEDEDGDEDEDEAEENEADAKDSETADNDEAKSDDDSEQEGSETILSVANYPLGAFGRTEMPEQTEWLLIKNATIWTCGEAGIIEGGSLLIHNGQIEAVGTDIDAPENCTVIDAEGQHLSPGIIDCHTHMATDGGVNESSQAVTAEVRIGDFVDATDITIYRHLAGGVTSANVLHGSANPIGGQNQVIKLRWGQTYQDVKFDGAPEGIKFALGENVKQSNRSNSSGRYPQSRMGVEQIYRDRFEAAKDYLAEWEQWKSTKQGMPPRRDLELETIAQILNGDRWIHCHSYRQDEILAFLRVLEDYGVTIGSLQHILEGYKVAEAMKAHGAMASSFSDWWAYKFEVYDAIPYNGALMHNMGIVVSFNSDDAELARHLNHEAAKAVKYGGVPKEEALKFVTLNPAKQLRIDDRVGSIEVGKDADFVLWSRSPLSTMSRCEQTWIDGRKYFDRAEDAERQKADAKLHQQLVQKIINDGVPMVTEADADDIDPASLWPRHDEFCHHQDHDDD
jgi:N-acetylglucosamine-6-phosphate deacetylase